MPGPGGGGRSGGGGRGFGGGGGFGGHGGGFGGRGGMHHGHHHGHPHGPRHYRPMGGWWLGPRYYGGGGCLSGVMGAVFAIVIVVVMIIGLLGSTVMELVNGGSVRYDEASLQQYADSQYAQAFGGTAYEDNLLIVFLTDPDGYDFTYIAWVGDHIAPEISDLLGDNSTELGRAMASYISDTDYTYSLDTDLARVIKVIGQKIKDMDLSGSFTCQETNADAQSRLINRTDLPMTEETVNQALGKFTEITGIPCVIVVEEAEAVFGRSMSMGTIAITVVAVVVLAVILAGMIRNRRNRGNGEDRYADPY